MIASGPSQPHRPTAGERGDESFSQRLAGWERRGPGELDGGGGHVAIVLASVCSGPRLPSVLPTCQLPEGVRLNREPIGEDAHRYRALRAQLGCTVRSR